MGEDDYVQSPQALRISKMAAATFQFGAATPKTTSNVSFGGKSTGFNFGSGTTSSSGLTGAPFGAVATQSGGISAFGKTTSATILPSTSSAGFKIGGATPSTGFTLGGLNTSAIPSQAGFGNTGLSTTTAGFSFGQSTVGTAASQGTSGFSFLGGQKATTGLTLGPAALSTATSGSGFSFGGAGGKTSGSTAPTLGALSQTTATTTPLFGSISTATTTTAGIGLRSTESTVTGLGGLGTSTTLSSTVSASNTVNQKETTNLKDIVLPGPFGEIVENIKKYVKAQKEHRDEISRFSVSSMEKVREETVTLRQTLALVSNSIQRDGCAVENLKMDVAQEYFQSLVESFEERMQVYRKQIEIMESHLASLSQSQTLTPQDLSEVMHKIHKTFISLAAFLHAIHEAVKVQKEHYLNYRKAYFKDTTDVFASNYNQNVIGLRTNAELGVGPSPFNHRNGTAVNAALIASSSKGSQGVGFGLGSIGPLGRGAQTSGAFGALAASGNPSVGFGGQSSVSGFGSGLGTTGGLGGGLASNSFNQNAGIGFGIGSSSGLSFGTPQAGATFGGFGAATTPATPASATQLKPFQLQRPPAGSKRGKKR